MVRHRLRRRAVFPSQIPSLPTTRLHEPTGVARVHPRRRGRLRPVRPRHRNIPLGHRQLRRRRNPRLWPPDRGLPGPPRAAVGDHQAPPRQQPLPDGGHRRRLRFSGESIFRRPRRAGVRRRLRGLSNFQPAVPCVGPHAEGEAPAGGGGAPGRRNPTRAAAARGAPPPSVQQ
ncbi:hypothetical protein DH2020_008668 [Rehmannia glutinosa]|uniref:Uncharacterized protein n=1 Tax=Rehmannia glutinosa TaxID=99300 RepID=A0ABR0X7I2_REHGL